MDQGPDRRQRTVWLAPAFVLGSGLVLGLLATLFMQLFPGHKLVVMLLGCVVLCGGLAFGVGLDWNYARGHPEARRAVLGLAGVFLISFLAPLIADRTANRLRFAGTILAIAALMLVSMLAGFGLGRFVAKRRHTHGIEEGES